MSVYVFGEPGSLLVKVGHSHNPAARLMNLRPQYRMPDGVIRYEHKCPGWFSQDIETKAHKLLRSRFWVEREWFVCGLPTAKSAIRHARKWRKAKYARRAFA